MANITKEEKILKTKLFKLGLKRCPKCGYIKTINSFYNRAGGVDGLDYQCIKCKKKYNKSVIKQIKFRDKKYYKKNKNYINKQCNLYYKDNKKVIAKRKKLKHKLNKESDNNRTRNYHKAKCVSKYFLSELKNYYSLYEARLNSGFVEIKCYYCKNNYVPTNGEIMNLIHSNSGYKNIYCSSKCKELCVEYNFHSGSVDPRSIKYIAKSTKDKARNCQTDHLKQLQIDEFGYNYCEKCGEEVDIIELHHTLEVSKFGLNSVNSAGHLLVCNKCHKEFTKQCR